MNSKLTLSTLMALPFMCLSLSCVHAAGMNTNQNMNMQQPDFSFFDVDNNNQISAQEFEQARVRMMEGKSAEGRQLQNREQSLTFAELDGDGDGFIIREEFKLHQQNAVKNKAMLKNKMNMQGDKSQQKMQSKMKNKMQKKMANMQQPAFGEFDSNGDKQITREEFNALRRERIKERTEAGRALQYMNMEGAFDSFDKNKDGVLSEEEFAEHMNYANPANKNGNKGSGNRSNSNSNNSSGGKSN